MEIYDPKSDTWSNKKSMSFARRDFQTQVVNGKIYSIGGCQGNKPLSLVEEYDPATDTWAIKKSMNTPRIDFRTEVIDGKIYSMGGSQGNKVLNSVEEYSPETDTWSTKKSMNTPRECFPAKVIGGKIYVIGGENNVSELSSVEVYDPVLDTWSEADSMNYHRAFCEAVLLNGKLFAIGGIGNNPSPQKPQKTLNTVEEYNVNLSIPVLTVNASPNKVKVGQQFTTDVAIHNVTNICAEDIKITYDKDLFEYEGATGQTGTKIYKEDTSTPGTIRFITACQGKDNSATGDKELITLKFKAKKQGVGKVDITKGRIADNATLEEDVADENCGEDTITVDGYADVNRTGNFTLLDLGIDAYYYGMNASDIDSTKYDADVISDGKIDDNDLTQITQEILANKDYAPNNY